MRSKYTFVNDLLSRGYIRLIKGDNNVVEGMFYLNFRGKNTLLYFLPGSDNDKTSCLLKRYCFIFFY